MKAQLHQEIILTMNTLEARYLICILERMKSVDYDTPLKLDEWINFIELKLPTVD